MKHWITAIRPKTLTAGLSPIVLGLAFALGDGFFNAKILILIIIATLAIQIGTNLTNDYFDYLKGVDDHTRRGPAKVLVDGSMTLQSMRKGIIAIFTIAALASSYLVLQGGWPIAVIAISSIAFAILYTAGPFPLGNIGLADPVELIYFGPIAVGGTYYLLANALPLYVIIGGFIPGFLSLAILTVDNLRDHDTDKAKGKKSLCVRFGKTFAKCEYYACIFLGFTIPLLLVALTKKHFLSLSCFILLPLYKTCLDAVKEDRGSEDLNKALSQTAMSLLIFTLIFSTGWLL
jgi:1,4-dihydroxy-2-naphthoate polyprenyltransferase